MKRRIAGQTVAADNARTAAAQDAQTVAEGDARMAAADADDAQAVIAVVSDAQIAVAVVGDLQTKAEDDVRQAAAEDARTATGSDVQMVANGREDCKKNRGFLQNPFVYYEKYGEQVYVRNVQTRKDYLFNEITYDILECFSKTCYRSAGSVLRCLRAEYEIDEADTGFEADILEFLDVLTAEGILLPDGEKNESAGEKAGQNGKAVVSNAESDAAVGTGAAATGAEAAALGTGTAATQAGVVVTGTEAADGQQPGAAADSLEVPGRSSRVFEAVQDYCTEHRILHQLTIELTYRCNERCVHCYVDGPDGGSPELTLEDYRKVLSEARSGGCLYLLLTGGEVCTKPEWLEVAEYAASIGMLVDIYTNGLAVTDDVFERIVALHPNSLSYSLYGSTAAVHDAITRVPGSFKRTLHSIRRTKAAGIDTYIKTVVMKENVKDLEALFLLGRELQTEVAPALTIFDTYAGHSRSAHMLETVDDYEEILRLCMRYAPRVIGNGMRDPDAKACGAGQCSLSIDPYGNVRACMSVNEILGNVREQGILDIWQTPEPLDAIRKVRFADLCDSCRTCSYVGVCNICMGRKDPKTGALPPDICMLAEASWRASGGALAAAE